MPWPSNWQSTELDGSPPIRSVGPEALDVNLLRDFCAGMKQSIATIALVVADYDEAIAFYRDAVGFTLVEDTRLAPDKRWVVLAPPGGDGARLLLAKADGPDQRAVIGKQAGGRVMLFLQTDDFDRDYARMQSNGVRFLEAPRREAYGTVAVFVDLYGNKWDLIEPQR